MKKILVTTDFSDNSKAGLYFALQMANQQAVELTFFYSCNIIVPNNTKDDEELIFFEEAIKTLHLKLQYFVADVYKEREIRDANYQCIVTSAPFTETNIMEYAAKNGFNFICISTRGANKLKRILGTNTANIINFSDVPVIAVPSTYKPAVIQSILYASDLENLKEELAKVILFAEPLKAAVELVHFISHTHKNTKAEIDAIVLKELPTYPVKILIENRDNNQSMIENLEAVVESEQPSLLVMFTEQNRNLFQQIFMSSASAEYSFNAKVPILVFKKK